MTKITDKKIDLANSIILDEQTLQQMFVEKYLNMQIKDDTPIKELIYKICKKMEEIEQAKTEN